MSIISETTFCNACHTADKIVSNGDAACCTECGTPEDYVTVTEYEDGKIEFSKSVIDSEILNLIMET